MKSEFNRKLRKVHVRWGANVLVAQLGWALLIAGGVAAAAAFGERALAAKIAWLWPLSVLLSLAVVGASVAWWLRRPSRLQAAVLLDERLGTRERFSTTLALAGSEDPFAQAARQEAYRAAAGIRPSGQFPIRPTRRWAWAAAAWAAFAGICLFVPELDLFGRGVERRKRSEQAAKVDQAKADVAKAVARIEKVVEQLGEKALADDLAKLTRLDRSAQAAEVRREAIRKLGEMADRMKKLASDDSAEALKQMQSMMRRMKTTPGGLDDQLNRALARGDFGKASRMLNDLQRQLEAGKLSEADKEKLAKQLKDMAAQLAKLAAEQKELEDALKKAGVDEKLAALSEEQLRKALKKAGLTQEQIEEMLKKARACQSACSQCRGLGGRMGLCGAGLAGGEGVPVELAEVGEQLSELESLAQRLALMEAALEGVGEAIAGLGQGQCEGGGVGMWLKDDSAKVGVGPGGGRARAWGLRPTGPDTPVNHEKTGVKNKDSQGPVIASWLFKGEQVKGASKRQRQEVVRAARDHASEAIEENRIPRQYQPAVRKYFGEMDKAGP